MTEPRRSLPTARLALALASVALLAALVGAVGPARDAKTTFTWPPPTLEGAPSTAWYTPLLLVRERPSELSAHVPCALPPALAAAVAPTTVLATARDAAGRGGFEVVRQGEEAVIRSGGQELGRVPLRPRPAAGAAECGYDIRLAGNRWSLEGPQGALGEGALESMPYVSGLFSELDLRSEPAPAIEVTTEVHATHPVLRQGVAWAVAALCALGALVLVASGGAPRRARIDRKGRLRGALGQVHAVDAVVAAALLVWWVVAPAFFDDGWVVARQSMFSSSGGFSEYYSALAVNQPLGYWLEWLEHWVTEASSALVLLRLPALACLAAIWVLSRWVLARALGSSVGSDGVALWALAAAFLVCALSWGMTLRPEPAVALLVTGVVACTARFLERPSAAPLGLATVLVALALSAHPAGIVTFAPLLVASPALFTWARGRLATSAAIVTCGAALLVTLAFVGSDLAQRRLDAEALGTYGATDSWRNEINRYSSLLAEGPGTPLRRESVGLIALAVVAYVLRRRRESHAVLDLPAPALAVALVLLIATPSKWSWHFGTLIGLAALAVACETARLQDEGRRAQGWSARPFLVVAAAVVVAAWSPGLRHVWMALDLRTLEWTLGFEAGIFTLPKLAALVPLALLAGAGLVAVARGRDRLHEAPWRAASWTAPALAAPLLAFTVVVFVADAAKTDSWTLTRQNVEALRGDLECGLADDAVVAKTSSMRPLAPLETRDVPAVPPWVPSTPLDGLRRLPLELDGNREASSPWFRARSGRSVGVFVSGMPAAPSRLELEWGRRSRGGIESLSREEVSALRLQEEIVPWRFFPAGELPVASPAADAVRFVLVSDVPIPATVTVTAPVTYENEGLASRLASVGSPTLVPPHLRMYVPCVEQPRLADGVVEIPRQIVGQRGSFFPIFGQPATPFSGLMEIYRLHRLPLADSADPPGDVVLYEVDRRIPGGRVAAPEKADARDGDT